MGLLQAQNFTRPFLWWALLLVAAGHDGHLEEGVKKLSETWLLLETQEWYSTKFTGRSPTV